MFYGEVNVAGDTAASHRLAFIGDDNYDHDDQP